MALHQPITAADEWFAGEDKDIIHDIKQPDGTTPQNMTGWSLEFELFDRRGGAQEFILTSVLSEIVIGDGDATNDRSTTTVEDEKTEDLSDGGGTYYYELWRVGVDNEALLAYGDAVIKGSRAAA